MTSKLAALCTYMKGKIAVDTLDEYTYIFTENMIPNKGGIDRASSLPSTQYTQAFDMGDVLVSNIRPYFKKIWMAEYSGGCSNDVLVFRANKGCDPTFLYYVLANDSFFDYATATSKGTKMPRGDKTAIMQYEVPSFDNVTQQRIGSFLKGIDKQIVTNKKINEYLRLLRAARAQGKHRLYLVIKLFAVTGVPVQSIGQVTAELVRAGGGTVRYRGKQEMVHIPPVLQREILDYLQEQGIVFGPIFLSVRGEPMGRVQMFRELQELCADAHVPVQKGNPRALRNLYRETIDSIAKNMDVLIQGAYEQFLQAEQTTAGWNTAE